MDQQLENARFGQTIQSVDGERFLVVRTWNGESVRAIATDSRERWCLRYSDAGDVVRSTYAEVKEAA